MGTPLVTPVPPFLCFLRLTFSYTPFSWADLGPTLLLSWAKFSHWLGLGQEVGLRDAVTHHGVSLPTPAQMSPCSSVS